MKRIFVGIKIHPNPKLLDFYSKLRNSLGEEQIRWIPIENMHITLKFLGETGEALIPLITEKLKITASNFEPFSIDIQGLDQFKKRQHTKVIWLGLENTNKLNELAGEIDKALNKMGFENENRAFKAHLTLGRVKFAFNEELISNLINEFKNINLQTVCIENILLFESILRKSGSKYKVIEDICL